MKPLVIAIFCFVVFLSISSATVNGGRTEKTRLAEYGQLMKVSSIGNIIIIIFL